MNENDKTYGNNPEKLSTDSDLLFSCHQGISCFSTCCRDITILLTPHDVMRLKNKLEIPSDEFLDQYTTIFYQKNNPFPFVQLKMAETEGKPCYFVDEVEGCSVYDQRPWACRMYPLDIIGEDEFSFVVTSTKCKGLLEDREWVVSEWLQNQGIKKFDELDYLYAQLTGNRQLAEQSINNPRIREMILMAAYDLDNFRRFVFDSKFLDIFDLQQEHIELLKTDDFELLKIGFKWLGMGLVNPLAIRIKEDVIEKVLEKKDLAEKKEDGDNK